MMKLKLEIEIKNIEVKDGQYSFCYTYTLNDKSGKESYESDYEGWTEKEWEKMLKKGEAIKIALEKMAERFEV